MRAAIFICAPFLSLLFFPWPAAVVLSLIAAWYEPLIPFAAGIFADALYYTAHGARLPWFTLGGALVSVMAVFVRSRLKAGTIGG